MSVTAKGEKIPQTVESLQDIMAKDADTMIDMDATIGSLRAKVNQLQQSRTKHLKQLSTLREALDLIINMDNQMFTLGDACSVAIDAVTKAGQGRGK